jgi:D-glycero-D-manno-heptose 1,7-bisphosphate phosphatase
MIQLPGPATQLKHRPRNCSTVFLDRDGTINIKAPDGQYIMSPTDLTLIPGAASAISRLNAAALRVILVTNQRWLAAEGEDLSRYHRVHAHLEELLAAEGAYLDAAYYCPHARGSCNCRKPGSGMLRRAAIEHGFRLDFAVMIGDRETDIEAGQRAGTATILLSSGEQTSLSADFVVNDLTGAVNLILGHRALSRVHVRRS